MKITLNKIMALKPCKDRFDNFVAGNPNFSGSVIDFLSSNHISYGDKVWVCVRLMTRNQRFYWARSCAFSVLDIFEAGRPGDSSLRDLFNYINTIDDVTKLTEAQFSKIRKLRLAAASAAAYAASAAAYAASAADAADAAAYAYATAADAAYAAYAAAYAAATAYVARQTQEEINLILLAYVMDLDI